MKTKLLLIVSGIVLIAAYLKRETIKNLFDMQISKNFWLREFTLTKSKHDNTPNDWELQNIKQLIKFVVQPVRDLIGSAMIGTSGFRSELVNKEAGGVTNSDHRTGSAWDFYTPKLNIQDVYYQIYKSNIPYHQLILEPRPKVPGGYIIHISYNAKPKRQALIEHVSELGKKSYTNYTA